MKPLPMKPIPSLFAIVSPRVSCALHSCPERQQSQFAEQSGVTVVAFALATKVKHRKGECDSWLSLTLELFRGYSELFERDMATKKHRRHKVVRGWRA